MIRSEQDVGVPPEVVHDLITDVSAWSVWSPHVASVDVVSGDRQRVHAGWTARVRPWFGPATPMVVTSAEPGAGITWQSEAFGYRLRYRDGVEPVGPHGARLVFEAELDGPAAAVIERAVAPLSALGQRRRMRRLAAMARLVGRRRVGGSQPGEASGDTGEGSGGDSPTVAP